MTLMLLEMNVITLYGSLSQLGFNGWEYVWEVVLARSIPYPKVINGKKMDEYPCVRGDRQDPSVCLIVCVCVCLLGEEDQEKLPS